jgi:DNA (cytosine-5)-methyltransferase 1
MHPDKLRALTAHEAARIQGFPDYFDFSAINMRSHLATMIGNAVPPALMRETAALLIPYLRKTTAEDDPNAPLAPVDRISSCSDAPQLPEPQLELAG